MLIWQQAAVLNKLHGYQMLWKIDNYAKKMQEAEEGISIAIESPIFWLSRDGYRIQMSACLNGDGKGKLEGDLKNRTFGKLGCKSWQIELGC